LQNSHEYFDFKKLHFRPLWKIYNDYFGSNSSKMRAKWAVAKLATGLASRALHVGTRAHGRAAVSSNYNFVWGVIERSEAQSELLLPAQTVNNEPRAGERAGMQAYGRDHVKASG
jgi:hypothetical protein